MWDAITISLFLTNHTKNTADKSLIMLVFVTASFCSFTSDLEGQ